MREERTVTQTAFGRVPLRRLSWPAIFGGAFFALGIMLVLSLFGVAIGAAAAGPQGATPGVRTWAGIWSLVTVFLGFLAGGWLAARASSVTRAEGRLHGIVTWGLGLTAIFYFAVNSTTRIAGVMADMTGNIGRTGVTPGVLENITATAAAWGVIVAVCGLIGALIGGHAGAYISEPATGEVRRAA